MLPPTPLSVPEPIVLTQNEIEAIERYEEGERIRMAEEDIGFGLDGIEDAYDSEEDWSFGCEDDETLVGEESM